VMSHERQLSPGGAAQWGSILAILGCLWIIKDLRIPTILVFLIWTAVVLAWYFAYGRKHSHLGRHEHVGLIKDEQVS
jgi:basic amino acid/polyamine antiporter, APA family